MSTIREYLDFIADRFLSIRPRSEKEMRVYLSRKLKRYELEEGSLENQVEAKIVDLKEHDLIDDKAFAQWYVDEKTRFKSRGPIRIRLELKQKGIAEEYIEEALGGKEETDENLLKNLLETRYRSRNMNDRKEYQKVVNGLLRRGFSISAIKKSIEDSRSSG